MCVCVWCIAWRPAYSKRHPSMWDFTCKKWQKSVCRAKIAHQELYTDKRHTYQLSFDVFSAWNEHNLKWNYTIESIEHESVASLRPRTASIVIEHFVHMNVENAVTVRRIWGRFNMQQFSSNTALIAFPVLHFDFFPCFFLLLRCLLSHSSSKCRAHIYFSFILEHCVCHCNVCCLTFTAYLSLFSNSSRKSFELCFIFHCTSHRRM